MSKLKKDKLYFLPLGGSGEIGMNLNLYCCNGKWIMVDLGISFERALGIDVVMPNTSFIEERQEDLLGLVVTHAHEDHIGAIPYLWNRFQCPIYATPFTAFLIREKLRDVGLLGSAKIVEIKPREPFDLGPYSIEYVAITHSIPEANVLKIDTPHGRIVHTGDWKLDDHPVVGAVSDEAALRELGAEGVLALLCDSTNIFEEGEAGSELTVQQSLKEIIKAQKKRVVVTCFSSNLARISSCLKIAEETGRKVVLVGRSMWRMVKAAEYCGYIKSTKQFLGEEAFNDLPADKVLMVCTGSQGEPRAALTKMAQGTHNKVRLRPGDTIIYSSREIPGNEPAIHQIQDALIDAGLNLITDNDDLTHVSGHPQQDELKRMYSWVRPKILIPVHGERAHLREHAAFGLEQGIPHTFVPRNGMLIELSEAGPREVDIVEHGRFALDGAAIVAVDSENIRERERLMNHGVVMVTLEFDKRNNSSSTIQLSTIGLPDIGQEGSLTEDLTWAIQEALLTLKEKHLEKGDYITDVVCQAVRRTAYQILNKKPQVKCHIIHR